jgi:dihydroorotate dehydrogenase electron transfer subunit
MTISSFQQKGEIVRSEKLGAEIYRFTVKVPDIAQEAKPGQFVMVKIGEGLDPLLRRPFSVHQVVDGGLIQILFKVVGKGTKLLTTLHAGMPLDILGPLGKGFIPATEQTHCLVGGGIGIAPLLFLVKQLLAKNEPGTIKVLLGARSRDEIEVLADDFGSLGLEVLIATEDGSLGTKGLVTDLMSSLSENARMVYSCGPYPMLRAVAGLSREKSWNCQVSLEAVMACGLGACLGCTVMGAGMQGYVHVCKDGPVFNAEEIAWL